MTTFNDLTDFCDFFAAEVEKIDERPDTRTFEECDNWRDEIDACVRELRQLNSALEPVYEDPREMGFHEALEGGVDERTKAIAEYEAYLLSLEPLRERAKVVYSHFCGINYGGSRSPEMLTVKGFKRICSIPAIVDKL